MNEFQFIVLKGRHILARGKRRRSVALGWRKNTRFVRGKNPTNELSNIRTKWSIADFPANDLHNSVRKMVFILNSMVSRTVSSALSLPRATFRIVPPENFALSYYTLAFQAEKITCHDLCIKSSYV